MMVFLFGAMVRRQQQIVAQFQRLNATAENRATTQARLGIDDSLAFRILRREAIIRNTHEARVYLDQSQWDALDRRRRRLGILIPILVAIAAWVSWTLLRRS